MTRQRSTDEILARADGNADYILRTARIDLDLFLACDRVERARRWREDYSTADREDLVRQQLTRRCGDWSDDDITHWVQHYDAKYGATDRQLPATDSILDVAAERFDDAQRHGDLAGAAQLARLRQNVARGAHLVWTRGDLLVSSVNTPGAVYVVNARGCSCPNGQAGKSQCWHVALYDLLLDLQQEAADAADVRAARADLLARLSRARAQLLSEAA